MRLDKTKPVYVTCQVGLRGYVATRILTQNGFDACNLAGGYRLYHSIFGPHETPKGGVRVNTDTQLPEKKDAPVKTIVMDACGLQCPGPIVKLSEALAVRFGGRRGRDLLHRPGVRVRPPRLLPSHRKYAA